MDSQSSPSTPTSIVIKWETAMPGPCVVTGADASQQDLLPFWLECLRRWNPQVPVVFADFGLTEEARSWCQHRGIVRSIQKIPNRKSWFSKPLAILAAGYEQIVWLDADMEVQADISPLWGELFLASGLGTTHDGSPPGKNPPGFINSGLVVARHGLNFIPAWAKACLTARVRGDQEVLYALGARCNLPQTYNHVRQLPNREQAKVVHWWGDDGKAELRWRLRVGATGNPTDSAS